MQSRYGTTSSLDEQEVLAGAVGSWTDRDFDGVEYVDRLRSGRRLDNVR